MAFINIRTVTPVAEVDDEMKALLRELRPLHRLSQLIIKGDNQAIVKIIQFLKKNPNIIHKKSHTAHGRTFVHVASMVNDVRILKLFLKHGANVNVLDNQKRTPLYYACKYCAYEAAKLLLEHGARVDKQSKLEYTALHWIAYYGHPEISEILLNRGADPNVMTTLESASTPFHQSFSSYNVMLVQMFIRYGANVHLKNGAGENAIHLASYAGMYPIIEMLLVNFGMNPNEVASNGMAPLHYAILSKKNSRCTVPVIELLLKYGAQLDIADKTGRTPLYIAVELAKHTVANLLLDKGANVNGVSGKRSNGDTKPLFAALKNGDEEMMETLFSHDATADGQDSKGNGVLHIIQTGFDGVQVQRIDIIEELIARGARVNERNLEGNTPLYIAVCEDLHENCETLLDEGANPYMKNSKGMSPIGEAIESHDIEYLQLLLKCGPISDDHNDSLTIFQWGLNSRDEDKVAVLLDAGVKHEESRLVATYTAGHSSTMVMHVLLKRDIIRDLNEKDNLGKTPIVAAIENWQIDMVRYLLEVGVTVLDRRTGKSDALVAAMKLLEHNRDCYVAERIMHLVLQHVTFYIAEYNVRLCDEDFQLILRRPVFGNAFYQYLVETKNMCTTRVNGTHVTYLDLCTKRNNALVECLKFIDVRKGLGTLLHRQLFPSLGPYIEMMCIIGMRRLQLIDTVRELLNETLYELQLPYVVTANIAELMATRDLETTAQLANRCPKNPPINEYRPMDDS